MENKIQFSQVLELVPDYVDLHEIVSSDTLNDYIDLLQECIAQNSLDALYEQVDNMYMDREDEVLNYYKQNIEESLVIKYNLEKDVAHKLVFETYQEKTEELLYERNNSDAIRDLLKNTDKVSIFIDLGLQIEEDSYAWTRGKQSDWLKKIKRKLKITSPKWDDDIRIMLSQASYGGQLVVYFYESVDILIKEENDDWKSITFTNPAVAIINIGNGSGDHIQLKGHTVSVAFDRENVFIDQYFKYSYVEAVCGMDQNWCKNSQAQFSSIPIRGKKREASPLAAQALQDRKYAEMYKKGGCTSFDMDINRHRDVYYINNFPCGSKCPHCGTFWID
ncbi:hypothetical protein FACS189474_5440 [Bacteroidia bacterium]|nr:hypothetical protein FACS189474_5440 [Bacteroidia bacterium]